MFLYKAPLVSQSMRVDNEIIALNSCWLYSASIARCSSADEAEFLKQKEIYLDKFREAGFSDEELDVMIKKGVSPSPETHQQHLNIMGLTKKIRVGNITGSFSEYLDATSQEKISMVKDIQSILIENGPLIMECPSMGYEAIHRTAITGVTLGKNSETGEEEICLISNDTMDQRLKALPLSDLLEIVENRGGELNFFTPPNKREQKPQLYSPQEFMTLLEEMPANQYKPSLKTDFAQLGIDTLIDVKSMNNISLNAKAPKADNPNAFFTATKAEGEKKKLLDKDSDKTNDPDDPNCCTIL